MPQKRVRDYSGNYANKRARKSSMRPRRRRMSGKIMLRVARNALLRAAETKYTTLTNDNVQLYHNGYDGAVSPANRFALVSNLLRTSLGTGQNNRVGDDVWPQYLYVKLWLSNKLDRPNVQYRLMIIATPPDQVTAIAPTGLFKATMLNRMLDFVDTDAYNIVWSRMINPLAGDYSLESGATNREHSNIVTAKIPLQKKGKIQYSADGGTIPKYQKHCLSLVVIAYDAYGTLPQDNIASFAYAIRFYFKDP